MASASAGVWRQWLIASRISSAVAVRLSVRMRSSMSAAVTDAPAAAADRAVALLLTEVAGVGAGRAAAGGGTAPAMLARAVDAGVGAGVRSTGVVGALFRGSAATLRCDTDARRPWATVGRVVARITTSNGRRTVPRPHGDLNM